MLGGNNGRYWVMPAADLRPLILEWAERNEYTTTDDTLHGFAHDVPRVMTLHQVLSHRSGVPIRRVRGILNGTTGFSNVSFDVADKLLCAMDMVDEWHGRLAVYYEEPIEVAAYEQRRLSLVAA